MSALLTSTCPGPCTAAEQMAEVLQLFAFITSDENLLSFPSYMVIWEPYSPCLHKRPHRWPYLVIQPPSFLSAPPLPPSEPSSPVPAVPSLLLSLLALSMTGSFWGPRSQVSAPLLPSWMSLAVSSKITTSQALGNVTKPCHSVMSLSVSLSLRDMRAVLTQGCFVHHGIVRSHCKSGPTGTIGVK